MKKSFTMITLLLSITIVVSQNSPQFQSNHDCQIFPEINHNITQSFTNCTNPDLEYYLKKPPIVSSFVVTEERLERIELVLKDEFNFTDIEIVFKQYNANTGFEEVIYTMFDDGTHGDTTANDKTFTNDKILLRHIETDTYKPLNRPTIDVLYKENGAVIHSNVFQLIYTSVSTDFLESIEIPNTYQFDNEDYTFSDNFIYYNKYNNWGDLECNQYGGVSDPNYIISKSLLYDFWGESVISNNFDNDIYVQVDFTNPDGQFLWGQDMALRPDGLRGVFIHEFLHLWIPNINTYLGFGEATNFNDTIHHPNIIKNTSGFLYSSWSRVNGVFCEGSIDNLDTDDIGDYFYIDYSTSYETCNGELESQSEKIVFNDFELYLMNLIPIEEVSFPITYFKDVYQVDQIIDENTGLLVGEKRYYNTLLEVTEQQLIAAKAMMLSDLGNPEVLNALEPNNIFLTFSGTKSELTNDEIKMLWVFSQDLITTGSPTGGWSGKTFYEATGERTTITANIPLPTNYTGDFFTKEHVTINSGEDYNGWTESGEYERILESVQYNDSIVTTILNVNGELSIRDRELENLEIYPNPSSGLVTISSDNFKNYTLFSMLGQVIESGNKTTFDVSRLKSGIYFIRVEGISENQKSIRKIIVK